MNKKYFWSCLITISLICCHHISCNAQTSEQSFSQVSSAVNRYMNKMSQGLLTAGDINKADFFMYSVSNESLYEDMPYTIMVEHSQVSVNINTMTGEIDRYFIVTPDQFDQFKKKLIDAKVRLEKDDNAYMSGAMNISLTVAKNNTVLFYGDTLDPDHYLSCDGMLDDVFWEMLPISFEELIDSDTDPAIDPVFDLNEPDNLFEVGSFKF